MCGIVGFNFKNKDKIISMLNSIRYRGPDDEGIFENHNCTLGHVRLSILDLSPRGRQPMTYDNLTIVFNGEVYNFKEIRKELEGLGYTFNSDTDTEVVLKAFHKWGINCLHKFRGMFAFAVYDSKKQKIYLVRDRVGVKPLYYYFDGNDFIFASEIRAIRSIKKLEINSIALYKFFQFGYISNDLSIFKNVHKLLPAHYLAFDLKNKELSIGQYYNILDYLKIEENRNENEILERLEDILIESFKYRMVSDVPVGVFLSGGTDSSIVSAILQKHYGNIHTFTIGFKESKYNEAEYAKKVAEHIGSKHTEKYLLASEAKDILRGFVDIYDEPFGDSSGIPTYLVSKVAKENGVKVVLSADGGDEIFCGYDRYWWSYNLGKRFLKIPKFSKKFIEFNLKSFKSIIYKIPMHNIEHKYNFLLRVLKDNTWNEIYETFISNYRDYELKKLLGFELDFEKKTYFEMGENVHPMQGMMLWDYFNYLPDDILVKVDRATMHNSIEGREPMLDNKIIEYVLSIPFEYKYKNGESKYILKKLLEKYLPKELIYRKKMGFGIPIFEWFKKDFIDLFENYFKEDDEFVNMDYVRMMFNQFKAEKPVNVNKLWFVLVYKMWKERYY